MAMSSSCVFPLLLPISHLISPAELGFHGAATENGYRTTDPAVSKNQDDRNRKLMVWQARYPKVSTNAIKALL